MAKLKVVLDTNFLLTPARINLDIFDEINRVVSKPHEFVVLDKSVEELRSLSKMSKNKKIVSVALQLLKAYNVKIIKTKSFLNEIELHDLKDADDYIIEVVRDSPNDFIVATQDKELKERLKNLGVKILTVRKKSFVNLEG